MRNFYILNALSIVEVVYDDSIWAVNTSVALGVEQEIYSHNKRVNMLV